MLPIEDILFSAGGVFLTLSLLPTVTGPNKPALFTALGTAIVILIFSITFATMGMWLPAAINLTQSVLWTVIGVQIIKSARA